MRFLYPVGQLCPNFTLPPSQIYHNSVLIKHAVKKYLLTINNVVVNKKLFISKPVHWFYSFIFQSRQFPAVPACKIVSVLIKGAAFLLERSGRRTEAPLTHHCASEQFLPAGQAGGLQSRFLRSVGLVKRRAGSMASGMKDRFTLTFGLPFGQAKGNLTWPVKRPRRFEDKGQKGVVHYLRQCLLTSEPLPAESRLKHGQAGFYSAQGDGVERGSAINKLPPSMISFLLTLVIIYSSADKAKSQQQELKIGDTIPQAVWDTPLQVLNHPEGKTIITLNAYKGKLLILDFWATSCGSCIAKMPEIADLNKEYKDKAIILPVSYQPGDKVARFMELNPVMKPLQLFTIVADTVLKSRFPHYYLPHEVWIDGNGKVLAFTESEYLDAKNIAKAIASQQNLASDIKEDQYLDKNKPLFVGVDGYYSKVGPHIKGFRYTSGVKMDSVAGKKRYYVINASLLQLYALALQSDGLPLNPKRRILKVKDPSAYVYQKDRGYQQEWRQQYTWTYEAVAPLAQTMAERKAIMLQTLNSYFNCTGRIAQKEIPCLVLQPLKHKRAARPLPGSACTSIANLLHRLNQDAAWPVLMDESGRVKEEELLLPAGHPDLETLNTALAIHGLQLVKAQRKLDVFMLTENSYSSSAHPK